jgi:hypothetical protein
LIISFHVHHHYLQVHVPSPSSLVLLCLTQIIWHNDISNLVSLITKTKLGLSSSQEQTLTTASAPVSRLPAARLPAAMLRGPAPVARSQAQRTRNKIVYSFWHRWTHVPWLIKNLTRHHLLQCLARMLQRSLSSFGTSKSTHCGQSYRSARARLQQVCDRQHGLGSVIHSQVIKWNCGRKGNGLEWPMDF